MLMAQRIPIFATTGIWIYWLLPLLSLRAFWPYLHPRSFFYVWLRDVTDLMSCCCCFPSNSFSVGVWKWSLSWPVVQWSALWPHNKKILGSILGLSVWSLHVLHVVLSSSLLSPDFLLPCGCVFLSLSALWWPVTLSRERLQWAL